ncbi:MAG: tyrosine--tRNA ligase, partial [Nanoarchaeota archaeon]
MNPEERFSIIKRNTQEILTEGELRVELESGRNLNAYYGIATTGPFHIAYLIPLTKVFDFSKVNIKTKILLADIHAILDDMKADWDKVGLIAEYYKKCIEHSLPWPENPEIVLGSSYQCEPDYYKDLLKIATHVTVNRATRAASEVTRMKNPKVSELIYPLMQVIDEEYLEVDIQIGGIDQRHIMALAREELPRLEYKSRIEIMTPLIASLKGPDT